MRAFEFRHIVGFEETNLVGNVYYAHHVRWQGKCREMFLREHCSDVVDMLSDDLRLVTLRCSCEYLDQLRALDEVVIRMRLEGIRQNRVAMRFDYFRVKDGREERVARGDQEIACMVQEGEDVKPCAVPGSLKAALEAYAG